MKNLKFIVTIIFSIILINSSNELFAQENTYTYAFISVEGKFLSNKLKVTVDLGDTPEQIKAGEEFSMELSNKKSFAAILNYMVKKEFELIETNTLEDSSSYDGSGNGGTSGIIFIMKKKSALQNSGSNIRTT